MATPLYTPLLNQVLENTKKSCEKANRPVNVCDLLAEILKLEKYKSLFISFNLNPEACVVSLTEGLPTSIPQIFEEEKARGEYSQVILESEESANDLENGFIDVEHVFHQLLNSCPTIRSWASIADIPVDRILKTIEGWLTLQETGAAHLMKELSQPDFPNIERFCENLTLKVANDDTFCFGREKEINQVLDILCRQKKSNILLLGEPGVGRKTLIQGVIEKILAGETSELLKDKEFFLVDIATMQAGTAMFGSLEQRFVNLIKEADQHGHCVLIIDNFQQVSGQGVREGTSEISNLLRPALNNPRISCIGITTQSEYKKIEKDQGITSRFEIIRVVEPNKEETRNIVLNSLQNLEEYHFVDFPIATVDLVIDLCERYLPTRRFPEKVFDFLDQLGAKAKNKHTTHPSNLLDLENKLADSLSPDLKEGSPEYKRAIKILDKYNKAMEKWLKHMGTNLPSVSMEDATKVFAEKYNISENQLKQLKGSTIDGIRERIKQNIFGQDKAVDMAMDILMCSKVGLRDVNKPLASLMFVGSTGVGKTEVARQIAQEFFGDSKHMLKLDMSEYQEGGKASALIGTSAGYIGYGDGGRLTEFVKHNPNSLILFDEVEKASPEILNLLLQIMDDGCLTDGHGTKVDFSNTIIILTSNLGAEKPKEKVGFVQSADTGERFLDAAKAFLKPEFIARLDEIIPFNSMTQDMLKQILNKFINQVAEKLNPQIQVTVDNSVKSWALKELYKDDSHSRKVRGWIRKNIEVPLAKFIIDNSPKTVNLRYENETLSIN